MESDFLKSDVGRSIRDFLWDDYLHLQIPLVTLDGLETDVTGSGAVDCANPTFVRVNSGTTSGSTARIAYREAGIPKIPGYWDPHFFDHHVKFQGIIHIETDTNQKFAYTWGISRNEASWNKFGIYVENDTLYARTCDGSAINDVQMTTFTAPVNLSVIAELFPGSKVEVLVRDKDTGDEYTATSESNLPSGSDYAGRLASMWVTNTAAESKWMQLHFHELWSPRWG